MANTVIISPTQGELYFDAVFKVEHKRELTITTHPIQSGASIADHSYFEPETVSMEIGYSDVHGEVGSAAHSLNAYKKLETIMEEREPVTLVTRLKSYPNMVITGLSVPDEQSIMFGVKATVDLTSVKIVYAQIVSVERKVCSGKQNKNEDGEINAESVSPLEEMSFMEWLNRLSIEHLNLNLKPVIGQIFGIEIPETQTTQEGKK